MSNIGQFDVINLYHLSYRLGEGCSHSAGILFKVETAVKNGYTSCTSNMCSWNQIFSLKVQTLKNCAN